MQEHFFLNWDEECLLACDQHSAIVGEKGRKKHERKIADSRESITMYRSGSAAGAQGPTGFIIKGKRCRTGFTSKFLTDNGAAPGSCFVLTENAFMTDAAWLELTRSVCQGIREMPVIRDHPDWWVVKTLDGFKSHVNSPEALQVYWDHKILLIKEEGDSSHVNQPFDRLVAKADKLNMRSLLAMIKRKVVDQWDLVHVGLGAVRAVKPAAWVESFKKCNLHPKFRLPFQQWLDSIDYFLEAGKQFKQESSEDKYQLLPSWWHGMLADEKKKAVQIFETHASWSVPCLLQLHHELHIPMQDMQKLRTCVELAIENPGHLDMTPPMTENAAAPAPVTAPRLQSSPLPMACHPSLSSRLGCGARSCSSICARSHSAGLGSLSLRPGWGARGVQRATWRFRPHSARSFLPPPLTSLWVPFSRAPAATGLR